MKLKNKFLFINTLVILSVLILSAITIYQFNSIMDYIAFRQQLTTMQISFDRLRHNELSYLAYSDRESADDFRTTYVKLENNLLQLQSHASSHHWDDWGLSLMSVSVKEYAKAFTDLSRIQNNIGLDRHDGLLGILTDKVELAETLILNAQLDLLYKEMLLLTRHEKDFLLRREERSLQLFDQSIDSFMDTLNQVEDLNLKKNIYDAMSVYFNSFKEVIILERQKGLQKNHGLRAILIENVQKNAELVLSIENSLNNELDNAIKSGFYFLLVATMLLLVFITLALLGLSRRISSSVLAFHREVEEHVDDIFSGGADLDKKVDVRGFSEIEDLSASFNAFTFALSEKVKEIELLNQSIQLVKQGLDNAAIPALMVDKMGRVSYVNSAMSDFIEEHAASFPLSGDELRHFPLSNVCPEAENIEEFFSSFSSHQPRYIQQGDLTIEWDLTAIVDADIEVYHYIIQWIDCTARIKAEAEIETMVSAAQQGDFSVMIDTEDKKGFYLNIGHGLNKISDSINRSLLDISSVLMAVASGQMIAPITSEYVGSLGELTLSINRMVKQLNTMVKDIHCKVDEARAGNFDVPISEVGKEGFFLHITQALNEQGLLMGSAMEELGRVMQSICEGNLLIKTHDNYSGNMKILFDINETMIYRLQGVTGLVNNLVDNAIEGNFSVRIPTDNQSGFYLHLFKDLNRLNDITEDVLSQFITALSLMSKGDLTHFIENDYHGIFEKLKNDTNAANANLVKVLTEIKQCSSGLNLAAEDLAACNLNLNQRTEKQANNLAQTASNMERMTSTIRQNTESSKNASLLADNTRKVAEESGVIVKQAIDAMAEIYESSNKITGILTVIDEIAFQTNLLALNASVEAARAGEQGRGVSVVASEGRNLAGRSANAAKEIKELIYDSLHKVEEGKALVNRSGESLTNIVDAAKEVSEIVTVIATASEDQARGIVDVNEAINFMDTMTQQNATLVEEIASTCAVLGDQSADLVEKINFFNTGNADVAKRAAAASHGHIPADQDNNDEFMSF